MPGTGDELEHLAITLKKRNIAELFRAARWRTVTGIRKTYRVHTSAATCERGQHGEPQDHARAEGVYPVRMPGERELLYE